MTLTLDELRSRISTIDWQIVQLLSERMKMSRQIGQYKKMNQIPLVDEQREKIVIQNICTLPHQGIDDQDLIRLYEEIIRISRNIQTE